MSHDKEKEILTNSIMVIKEQKKKEERKKHKCISQVDNKNLSMSDSKICIVSSVTDVTKKITPVGSMHILNSPNEMLKNDNLELLESKRSLGNKPFKIIEPGKEPIHEATVEMRNRQVKIEDEKGPSIPSNDKSASKVIKSEISSRLVKGLIMEIMESPTLKSGMCFVINTDGLVGSKREAKDGRVFFGSYTGKDVTLINDYSFPEDELGFGKRHFSIEYDNTKESYFLKDLGDGTGTFIKIDTKKVLDTNIIISFNNVHLAITLLPDPDKYETNTNPSMMKPLKGSKKKNKDM